MKIISIINKITKQDICSRYLNKDVDINYSFIEAGNPLKIKYVDKTFFCHEEVVNVKIDYDKKVMIIETTKKTWTLSE